MRRISKILIISLLSVFCLTIIIKCNDTALVKIECHSEDCESEDSKGSDCTHCITLKNVITPSVTDNQIYSQQVSYSSYKSIYDFYTPNLIYHPPKI